MTFKLLWLTMLAACSSASQGSSTPRVPVETTNANATPAPRPAFDCGSEPLRVELGARNVDTRDGPVLSPARYKKMRWAPGHRKPPGSAFAISPEQAIDAVVALEAKQPELIPAPYREALLRSPRDAVLRLQIAACEANDPVIRRRAAYDGAMAFLLGGSPEEASMLITLGTTGTSATVTTASCGKGQGTCAAGSRCDPISQTCVTALEDRYARISKVELAVETALTRGLIGEIVVPNRLNKSARGGWIGYMVHACGTQLCRLSNYEVDGTVSVVVWDLRDRGTVEEVHDSSPQGNVDFGCLDRCEEALRACAATWDVCATRNAACRHACS